jgi:hypothetical protein
LPLISGHRFGGKTICKKLEIVARVLNKMSVMIDFTTINFTLFWQKRAKKGLIGLDFFPKRSSSGTCFQYAQGTDCHKMM